jgi:ATP-dependent helicase/nuclease subunit A
LRGLRQQFQDAPDEAPAPAAEPRVRLLTIHAAKGLEAPVVYLADATHTTRPHTAYQALIDWPPQAQQPKSFLLSGRKDSLDRISSQLVEAQAQAEQREDANLLYVALTRAKQYLFISGCASQQLGWYGDIAACCGVDPESVGDGVVVSRCGDLPAELPPLDVRPVLQVEAPDARLSSPLVYAEGGAEIELAEEEAEANTGLRLRARVIRRALHLLAAAPNARHSEPLPQLIREMGVPAPDDSLLNWWQEACGVVQSPSLQDLFDRLRFQVAYNDVPLSYRCDESLIRASIDRLVIREGEVILVIYETDARAREDNLREMAARYQERLRHCARGVAILWPDRRVRAMVVFTVCATACGLPLDDQGS